MIKKVYICDHCSEEMNEPYRKLRVQNGVIFTSDEWHYCEKCWNNVLKYLNEGGVVLFSNSNTDPVWNKMYGQLTFDPGKI